VNEIAIKILTLLRDVYRENARIIDEGIKELIKMDEEKK